MNNPRSTSGGIRQAQSRDPLRGMTRKQRIDLRPFLEEEEESRLATSAGGGEGEVEEGEGSQCRDRHSGRHSDRCLPRRFADRHVPRKRPISAPPWLARSCSKAATEPLLSGIQNKGAPKVSHYIQNPKQLSIREDGEVCQAAREGK